MTHWKITSGLGKSLNTLGGETRWRNLKFYTTILSCPKCHDTWYCWHSSQRNGAGWRTQICGVALFSLQLLKAKTTHGLIQIPGLAINSDLILKYCQIFFKLCPPCLYVKALHHGSWPVVTPQISLHMASDGITAPSVFFYNIKPQRSQKFDIQHCKNNITYDNKYHDIQ